MPSDAVTVTINGTDRTHVLPFRTDPRDMNSQIHVEYTLPGIASANLLLYDFTNTVVFGENDNILILDPTTPGHALFQGYVTRRKVTIEANYRIWSVTCTDLNSWLDLKIVGAPDGKHFLQDPPGVFTAYDPEAVTHSHGDFATYGTLFLKYAPDLPVDFTTYGETIAPTLPGNWIRWNTVTLRQALEELANAINTSIRFWIDADWFFHWTIHPSPTIDVGVAIGPLNRLFPPPSPLSSGPRTLTDGPADHITTFNYDSLEVEYDDHGWADSIYVAGGTTYTYNKKTKKVTTGGSGWVKGIGPVGRQQILSLPNAHTAGVRDAYGQTALTNAQNVVARGTCRVTTNFGGWFPGQSINLTNAVLGLSASTYPIQRVTTDFISGLGDRIITLEFGDAPRGTIGLRANANKKVHAKRHKTGVRPGAKLNVSVSNSVPGTGGVVRAYAQAVDPAGNAWPIYDMPTTWGVTVYDVNCNDVTAATDWSLSSTTSYTNIHGMAWTDLTTSATTGLTYYIDATTEVVDQP